MKKAVCALLCLSILMLSLPALGADITDVMRVVNCQEWVSLREAPDTSSTRLAKVYLGEFVTFCNG